MIRSGWAGWVPVLAVATAVGAPAARADIPAAPPGLVVDDFEDPSAWSAHPAEGVTLALVPDAGEHGRALRLDVRFARGTGYAVARRAVSLDLPADYVFRLRLRGELPSNTLEFKLVDATGQNVWWHVRRDLAFPRTWHTLTTRKRQLRFAWGPAGGGEIRHVAFLEIAVTAGEGGAGSVWLDDLTLEPVAPDSAAPAPRARASSAAPGAAASRAVDGDRGTAWRSAPGDTLPWLELDLGRPREFGGLDLHWSAGRHATDYAVAFSPDGRSWSGADTVRGGNGGRDPLYLPESEARFIQVRTLRPVRAPVALNEVVVQPLAWTSTPEAYFTNLARDAARGSYPRPYAGEQCTWAVVGADAGREEALLAEDGMLETGKRRYSIEPFLWVGRRLLTWADVQATQWLEPGELAVPSVGWHHRDIELTVTAAALPDTGRPAVLARYRVGNPSSRSQRITLFLAARPFQVNPPWQNIGFAGGTARIHRIEPLPAGDGWRVDGLNPVRSTSRPSAFGAVGSGQGDIVEFLRQGRLPPAPTGEDPRGFASGALAFELELAPGGERTVELLIPLRSLPEDAAAPLRDAPAPGPAARPARAVRITLPAAPEVARTLDAQIEWILVNRDGGAIQPGSRNYDRSWIRDGSLTSSALLRMGHPDVVRDFIEWFAPFQYENGKIPCCASDRGPDPVTENDSHGQFVWLVADYWRHTGDRALVERMWPRVVAAVGHMDSLRGERRTAEWQTPEKRRFFGLLLPSISHEGYANPVHSYWDDFFAWRGYADAVFLAGVLGRDAERERIAAARDTFGRDLAASIAAVMSDEGIDYVPGCAERGDFDATSTTVALDPTDAAELLPETAIRATFERYWEFFRDRRDGKLEWDAFTPYEMRVIGSFVRLGWRDRADQALRYFMSYRSPPGWRQWAEVVHRDRRAPKYIGDMPHTWVGSDFVRSVLDMLAYERARDSSLVVAAGVPWRWMRDGIEVAGLQTTLGTLDYSMVARGDTVETRVEAGLRIPPGGILVVPPARQPFRRATVNGVPAPVTPGGAVVVRELPALVQTSP